MNIFDSRITATHAAEPYTANLDVNTEALLIAARAINMSDDQINETEIVFTDKPQIPFKQSFRNAFRKSPESRLVRGTLISDKRIVIYVENIFRIANSGNDPLVETPWADSDDSISNRLANHTLAHGMALSKEYELAQIREELNAQESAKKRSAIIGASAIGSVSGGYEFGILTALKSEMLMQHRQERLVSEERAREFANSLRAVNLFSDIIKLDLN